jgi:hypothetical protein
MVRPNGDWENLCAVAGRDPYYEARLKLQRARLSPGQDTAAILAAVEPARNQNDAQWILPIEDTRGGLLPALYQQLSTVSAGLRPAEALRRGPAEMIHSGTWQADPAYWAAFHLTGGVQ